MIKSYKSLLISSIVLAVLAAVSFGTKIPALEGITIWLLIAWLIVLCLKKSILQQTTMDNLGVKGHIVIAVACVCTVLVCILPMDLASFWNGRIPMHRNQYELLADSVMNGHLYIDYDDVDPKLLELENPYDYEARIAEGIDFHWDHAFYNGHYYMYFGAAPVFVLFVPFKLIFGKTLVTFHATQLFSMLSTIAFFWLFYMMAKRFNRKIPLGTYIFSAMAVTFIAIGYCTQAPALYCTAIGSAICFELWSICLYFYAVMFEKRPGRQVAIAAVAALCGALAFGCRPPVALANLLAIPLAICYAKEYKGKHIIRNFVIIVMPYIVIGALIMLYNYARFETPFEFGQSYQLTSSDQTIYRSFFERFAWNEELGTLLENFLTPAVVDKTFPFVNYGGLFVTYPVMMSIIPLLSHDSLRRKLKEDGSALYAAFLLGTPIFTTLMDIYWAPGVCERYRLDEYFVLGMLAFLLILYRLKTVENTAKTASVHSILAVISAALAVLMFFQPCDANFATEFPEKVTAIANMLMFH